MAYVNVPKDLTKVKTKVLFNLTKRQLICFGSGALIGVPLFFLLKGSIGTSPAAMVMMVVMIPAMLFAMYEKNGQPLEVVIRNIYRVCFQRSKQRPYSACRSHGKYRPATYVDTGCCPAPIFLSYPFGSLLRWRFRSVFVRRGSAFSFRTI